MIAFTSDIDWAPEEVIKYTISIFEKFGVKCTLFCTHQSSIIDNCNREFFEIGLHPNFNRIFNNSNENIEQIVDDLISIYPEAIGIRSHSLTQSSFLLDLFSKKGFKYESNCFLPYQTNLKIFKLWNGIYRIPYNWGDDAHWAYGHSFTECGMQLDSEDLIIFDFHPIHIYLNTFSQDHYNSSKQYYHNFDKLKGCRNTSVPGIETLLLGVLDNIKKKSIKTYKLKELC